MLHPLYFMGERFQDYSRIQDFEADFPQKVNLKILNKEGINSFSGLVSYSLETIDRGMVQALRFEILKFRILEILNFHPCVILVELQIV